MVGRLVRCLIPLHVQNKAFQYAHHLRHGLGLAHFAQKAIGAIVVKAVRFLELFQQDTTEAQGVARECVVLLYP